MKSAHPIKDEAGAPDKGAQIVASAGELLARQDTVRAGVLCHLLGGGRMTGLEAVFGASTTRLAAVICALTADYGWRIERTDKEVGCKDGRVQKVTEYHLLPAIIGDVMSKGAAAWCSEVRAARAAKRTQAADAQRAAAVANAARSKPSGPHRHTQPDLFQPCNGVSA